MDKKTIKYLISQHNNAVENVEALEQSCLEAKVVDEKSKANFGNLCVALRGYRMVADATEALLINENVLKDDKGDFYQKIEDDEPEDTETPEQANKENE